VPNSNYNSPSKKISAFRRLTNVLATVFAITAAVLVILPLLAIFIYLLIKGVQSLNWAFLTQLPKPPGEVGCGIYLAEYGRNLFGDVVRFTSDVLNGVPSIVIGIAVYSLIVVRQKHFSALAGSVALAVMMVPTVARATEEMLLMVPNNIREAALGLGIPKWRTTLSISLRTASAGVITGCMLAFARVAGETAPLLFTTLGNQYWSKSLNQPTAALPLQIYTYALSPYDDWHKQAWAGALILIVMIVAAVAAVRIVTSRGTLKGAS
jgi:phosphate transport system permease protein